MRVKITLASCSKGAIDFNYQHQIQGLLYGFLARSNPDYSAWLHRQGFVYPVRKYPVACHRGGYSISWDHEV